MFVGGDLDYGHHHHHERSRPMPSMAFPEEQLQRSLHHSELGEVHLKLHGLRRLRLPESVRHAQVRGDGLAATATDNIYGGIDYVLRARVRLIGGVHGSAIGRDAEWQWSRPVDLPSQRDYGFDSEVDGIPLPSLSWEEQFLLPHQPHDSTSQLLLEVWVQSASGYRRQLLDMQAHGASARGSQGFSSSQWAAAVGASDEAGGELIGSVVLPLCHHLVQDGHIVDAWWPVIGKSEHKEAGLDHNKTCPKVAEVRAALQFVPCASRQLDLVVAEPAQEDSGVRNVYCKVGQARELRDPRWMGQQDPFVFIELRRADGCVVAQARSKSAATGSGTVPRWDQTLALQVPVAVHQQMCSASASNTSADSYTLRVSVCDHNRVRGSNLIGYTQFVLKNGRDLRWYTLTGAGDDQPRGDVSFEVMFDDPRTSVQGSTSCETQPEVGFRSESGGRLHVRVLRMFAPVRGLPPGQIGGPTETADQPAVNAGTTGEPAYAPATVSVQITSAEQGKMPLGQGASPIGKVTRTRAVKPRVAMLGHRCNVQLAPSLKGGLHVSPVKPQTSLVWDWAESIVVPLPCRQLLPGAWLNVEVSDGKPNRKVDFPDSDVDPYSDSSFELVTTNILLSQLLQLPGEVLDDWFPLSFATTTGTGAGELHLQCRYIPPLSGQFKVTVAAASGVHNHASVLGLRPCDLFVKLRMEGDSIASSAPVQRTKVFPSAERAGCNVKWGEEFTFQYSNSNEFAEPQLSLELLSDTPSFQNSLGVVVLSLVPHVANAIAPSNQSSGDSKAEAAEEHSAISSLHRSCVTLWEPVLPSGVSSESTDAAANGTAPRLQLSVQFIPDSVPKQSGSDSGGVLIDLRSGFENPSTKQPISSWRFGGVAGTMGSVAAQQLRRVVGVACMKRLFYLLDEDQNGWVSRGELQDAIFGTGTGAASSAHGRGGQHARRLLEDQSYDDSTGSGFEQALVAAVYGHTRGSSLHAQDALTRSAIQNFMAMKSESSFHVTWAEFVVFLHAAVNQSSRNADYDVFTSSIAAPVAQRDFALSAGTHKRESGRSASTDLSQLAHMQKQISVLQGQLQRSRKENKQLHKQVQVGHVTVPQQQQHEQLHTSWTSMSRDSLKNQKDGHNDSPRSNRRLRRPLSLIQAIKLSGPTSAESLGFAPDRETLQEQVRLLAAQVSQLQQRNKQLEAGTRQQHAVTQRRQKLHMSALQEASVRSHRPRSAEQKRTEHSASAHHPVSSADQAELLHLKVANRQLQLRLDQERKARETHYAGSLAQPGHAEKPCSDGEGDGDGDGDGDTIVVAAPAPAAATTPSSAVAIEDVGAETDRCQASAAVPKSSTMHEEQLKDALNHCRMLHAKLETKREKDQLRKAEFARIQKQLQLKEESLVLAQAELEKTRAKLRDFERTHWKETEKQRALHLESQRLEHLRQMRAARRAAAVAAAAAAAVAIIAAAIAQSVAEGVFTFLGERDQASLQLQRAARNFAARKQASRHAELQTRYASMLQSRWRGCLTRGNHHEQKLAVGLLQRVRRGQASRCERRHEVRAARVIQSSFSEKKARERARLDAMKARVLWGMQKTEENAKLRIAIILQARLREYLRVKAENEEDEWGREEAAIVLGAMVRQFLARRRAHTRFTLQRDEEEFEEAAQYEAAQYIQSHVRTRGVRRAIRCKESIGAATSIQARVRGGNARETRQPDGIPARLREDLGALMVQLPLACQDHLRKSLAMKKRGGGVEKLAEALLQASKQNGVGAVTELIEDELVFWREAWDNFLPLVKGSGDNQERVRTLQYQVEELAAEINTAEFPTSLVEQLSAIAKDSQDPLQHVEKTVSALRQIPLYCEPELAQHWLPLAALDSRHLCDIQAILQSPEHAQPPTIEERAMLADILVVRNPDYQEQTDRILNVLKQCHTNLQPLLVACKEETAARKIQFIVAARARALPSRQDEEKPADAASPAEAADQGGTAAGSVENAVPAAGQSPDSQPQEPMSAASPSDDELLQETGAAVKLQSVCRGQQARALPSRQDEEKPADAAAAADQDGAAPSVSATGGSVENTIPEQ
jgi:hypothetical protein